jgi:hypothetical protein
MGSVSGLPSIADDVERYLRTGDTDRTWLPGLAASWSRGRRARADLRATLVQEVRRLAEGRSHEPVPDGIGVECTASIAMARMYRTDRRTYTLAEPRSSPTRRARRRASW